MKASELRIGNYILSKDNCIRSVLDFKEETYRYKLSNGNILKHHLKTANPITLTEQWLIDFGFEKFKAPICDRFCIVENSVLKYQILIHNGTFTMPNRDKPIIIKSVNQLQNLYFALTNKELKLK